MAFCRCNTFEAPLSDASVLWGWNSCTVNHALSPFQVWNLYHEYVIKVGKDLAGLQTPHIEVVLPWTVSWCLSWISGRRGQTVKIDIFQLGLQKKYYYH